jgi:hypothetical protein
MWDDNEFAASVESGRYPNDQFKHPHHIRLAWIYLRRYGTTGAEERMTATIRRFARNCGHEEKYHETMTRAWLRLVAVAQYLTPEVATFDDFIARHGWLLDRGALSPFYTRDCLSSGVARHGWVEPDRNPLPFLSGV